MAQTIAPLLLLRPGRLIDGTGGPVKERMAVLLEGSQIRSVGPDHELGLPEGAAGEVLEFPAATLLPGLIDCHTHTNMPGNGRRGEDVNLNDKDDLRLLRSAHNIATALQTGVTTVCDCGGWHQSTFSLKEGVQQGLIPGPRMLTAGRPITITGGHCWFMGSEADGVDGVRHAARQLIKEGADFLKVMATGGSTQGTDPFRPAYSAAELQAIVEEGHRRNKLVTAHCRTNAAMWMVVDVGFDIIMHGWFTDSTGARVFDEALATHIAEHGVWVNPTLHITRSRLVTLQARKERDETTPEEDAQIERMTVGHEQTLVNTRRLIGAGVRLMAGSDCGWGIYPFGRFDLELQAMVNGGLSPLQALVSATGGNANALGISDFVGTIAPGKEADLLVVDGNPDEDITAVAKVAAVFQAGRRVN
jgi:imidazolonepropionase-like amidohydrolase